jgi:hypothetical protein
MLQNLHPGKIFLSISAKYRVYYEYMKMAQLFQQCALKRVFVTTLAGLL